VRILALDAEFGSNITSRAYFRAEIEIYEMKFEIRIEQGVRTEVTVC
jgi:hypothetical protein